MKPFWIEKGCPAYWTTDDFWGALWKFIQERRGGYARFQEFVRAGHAIAIAYPNSRYSVTPECERLINDLLALPYGPYADAFEKWTAGSSMPVVPLSLTDPE